MVKVWTRGGKEYAYAGATQVEMMANGFLAVGRPDVGRFVAIALFPVTDVGRIELAPSAPSGARAKRLRG